MRKLKRWQIPFFAFASFGPCMLSTIISVYLVDALQTAGFGSDLEYWTFAGKTIVALLPDSGERYLTTAMYAK